MDTSDSQKGLVVKILYQDQDIVVCIKPPRVLSTDEPGGLPDCLREHFGLPGGDFRTVHRLDRVVSGVMVLARNASSASELSRQIRDGEFKKSYLAVIHGAPETVQGRMTDLLGRDKARKMTYIADKPGKGIQEAVLDYEVVAAANGFSLVKIRLHTGRTHQIRVQFSGRGMPLAGERKYAVLSDAFEIGLWSHSISFFHPQNGKPMFFSDNPPAKEPWTYFQL